MSIIDMQTLRAEAMGFRAEAGQFAKPSDAEPHVLLVWMEFALLKRIAETLDGIDTKLEEMRACVSELHEMERWKSTDDPPA